VLDESSKTDYVVAALSATITEAATLADLGFTLKQLASANQIIITCNLGDVLYTLHGSPPVAPYAGHLLHASGTYGVASARLVRALQFAPVSSSAKLTITLLGDKVSV
jgi:hypothetical protein